MGTILGQFNRDGKPVNKGEFKAVLDFLSYWSPDDTALEFDKHVGLGSLLLLTSGDDEPQGCSAVDRETRTVLVADLRIDNRDELARSLGLSSKELSAISDCRLALLAYLKWGSAFVAKLLGDFAIALWDPREQSMLLARDAVGCKPLYYACDHKRLLFSTEPRGILSFNSFPRLRNERWQVDALCGILHPDAEEDSCWQNVRLLPPATVLRVSPDGETRIRYWELDVNREINLGSESEYLEAFREIFQSAVSSRLRGCGKIAVELSGGLDCSSIVSQSIALGQDPNRFLGFSHASQDCHRSMQGCSDELDIATKFCQGKGLAASTPVTGPRAGGFGLFQGAASRQVGSSNCVWAVFSEPLYDAVERSGANILLSGAGGNDLPSAEAGLAYVEFCREGAYRKLARELFLEGERKGISRARTWVRLAGMVARSRFPRSNVPFRHVAKTISPFLLSDRIDEFGVIERMESYCESLRFDSLREQQKRWSTGHYLQRIRLPESSIRALARRVEIRYPILDRRLLEFCLAAPASIKRNKGFGRYLFRASVPALPDYIRWREEASIAAIPWSTVCVSDDRIRFLDFLRGLDGRSEAHSYLDIPKLMSYLARFDAFDEAQFSKTRKLLHLALLAALSFR